MKIGFISSKFLRGYPPGIKRILSFSEEVLAAVPWVIELVEGLVPRFNSLHPLWRSFVWCRFVPLQIRVSSNTRSHFFLIRELPPSPPLSCQSNRDLWISRSKGQLLLLIVLKAASLFQQTPEDFSFPKTRQEHLYHYLALLHPVYKSQK